MALAHRLDTRIKLAALLVYSVAILAIPSNLAVVVLSIIPIALVIIARIPFTSFLRPLVPVFILAAFTFAFYLIAHPSGEGALEGAVIALRMIALVAASVVVCFTATSTELLAALRSILDPLSRFGIPARDISFTLALSLRFMPMVAQRFEQVRSAQLSRGGSIEGKSPYRAIAIWGSAFSAVFISLFRTADTLATAMDARCYGASAQKRDHR